MLKQYLVLLVLNFQIYAIRAGYLCSDQKEICVYSSVQNDTAFFSIQSSTPGWVAIGISSTGLMTNSDSMIVWKSSTNGGIQVSDNYQFGHQGTSIDQQQDVSGIAISSDSTSRIITYNISRKLNTGDTADIPMTPGKAQNWILAGSNTLPQGSPPSFNQHDYVYVYKTDLFSNATSNGGSLNVGYYSDFATAHGFLMVLVWSVIMPVAIVVARSFKYIGPLWFRIHWGLAVISVLLMALSFGLIASQVSEHFSKPHTILGAIAILAGVAIQMPLGVYIDKIWDPHRKSVPIHDYAHIWLGRLLILFTIATIITGFQLYGVSVGIYVVYLLWIVILVPGVAIAVHNRYGKRSH